MAVDTRLRLPGTLSGLLEAGRQLYDELEHGDDLLQELLSTLPALERAVLRVQVEESFLLDLRALMRRCDSSHDRMRATLRSFRAKAGD